MSGYVATRELKEIPAKTWLTESDSKRIKYYMGLLDMSESALLRKAVLLMLARIEKEGYSAIHNN